MKKLLILVHRYVGIAIALLMSAWCLSGLVMMYVGYPALDEQERIEGLPPLELDDCCAYDAVLASAGEISLRSFAVEMLAGQPVLKLEADRGTYVVNLRNGESVESVTQAQALQVAADYVEARSLTGKPELLDSIESDQWTVTGAYNAYRPMYRVALKDVLDTQLYIAGTNGEVVLDSTARERFWNWFGAVTHWLYPSMLRQHAVVWSQVVVWTSLAGTFLTATGLWLGIVQIRAGLSRKFSPYSGWNWWHHVSGLLFGILLLAWVASGLLSMNPWGLLEGTGARAEAERLRNFDLTSTEAVGALRAQIDSEVSAGAVRISSAPFAGRLYLQLQAKDAVVRVDAETRVPSALSEAELRRSSSQLQPGVPILNAGLLTGGDAYYYDGRNGGRSYPVYRVILDDEERTRYYIDPGTGSLLQKTDREGRWYRWLFQALHSWDFSAGLRERPLKDLLVLPLLLGVTGLSLSGVYLGFRRVKPKRQ